MAWIKPLEQKSYWEQQIVTKNELDSSTNMSALQEVQDKFFQSAIQPVTGVNEGDLWYDLSTDKLKLYDGIEWGLISGSAKDLNDDFFKFTTLTDLSSGNVAEFKNGSSIVFGVRHDGVLKLKELSNTPPAEVGGLCYIDGELYIASDN
ncbi:MAG: hypothetical protein ISR95_09320 [Candidatus Marinimicrobia bacterium]|nr:hypothetical protein [Candidatus Neomarinimicrobiota bacterium]